MCMCVYVRVCIQHEYIYYVKYIIHIVYIHSYKLYKNIKMCRLEMFAYVYTTNFYESISVINLYFMFYLGICTWAKRVTESISWSEFMTMNPLMLSYDRNYSPLMSNKCG